jgi:hypothetical protein
MDMYESRVDGIKLSVVDVPAQHRRLSALVVGKSSVPALVTMITRESESSPARWKAMFGTVITSDDVPQMPTPQGVIPMTDEFRLEWN